MKLLNKILFIQKSTNLCDKNFCKKFNIKNSLLKEWKTKTSDPKKEDVINICDYFMLDLDDFVSDESSVEINRLGSGEHSCKLKPHTASKYAMYDEFGREDNARYEEKD